jgi:hypothetical protein
MDSKLSDAVTPPPAAAPGDTGSTASVGEDVQSLWHELLGLSHDRLLIAGLETQQAVLSLVSMVMAGIVVAGSLFGAWLGLLVAAGFGLVENGVTASSAILLAVALNLLLALVLVRVIRHQSHWLKFPATLRSLRHTPPEHRDTHTPQ